MLSCFITGLSTLSAQQPPVVTDNDLVMTRQAWGETRRNLSVSGKPLSIGGTSYSEGIGSHAISMIPVSVPDTFSLLTGACGIDDGANLEGGVEFFIQSGSEVLWKSGVMKKGMPAKEFSVPLPSGTRKLYLVALDGGNNDSDHADWVNLKWGKNAQNKENSSAISVLNAKDFGLKPNVREDQTPALRKAISAARSHPGCKLVIPQGTYHFFLEGALPMSFNISNHDQPEIHPVCIPLVDLQGVTLEGNDSLFLFHGLVLPVLVMDSSKVSIKGISLDYERPYYTEAIVRNVSDEYVDVTIDEKNYPYKIDDSGHFLFIGEGWTTGMSSAIAFEKGTGHIVEGTSDIGGNPKVTRLDNDQLRLDWKLKDQGIKPGDTLTLRNWGRPHPALVIYRAQDTNLKNVIIHQSSGMGILAQRSTNVTMDGGGVFMRKGTGRVHSSGADATHYSNVGGLIRAENAYYTGMMDDAINVHSTCLSIEKIQAPDTILCRYKHGQSVGFEVFLPGENLRFIAGPTLENKSITKVKSVRKLSTTEVMITLAEPLPDYVKAGDAVENADYQPAVIFKGNTISNNRARGSLFTTPKKVIVENNLFDHSSGSALLLAGDAQGWYESGACLDVVIRNNKFVNNLTSRYQFTNAIISIYPEVRMINDQKEYYHHNVLIENNEFDTFDVPLLYVISTKGLTFRHNTIRYNNAFKGWGKKAFEFLRCADILIQDNKITPPRQWTIQDCELKNTPTSEVTID